MGLLSSLVLEMFYLKQFFFCVTDGGQVGRCHWIAKSEGWISFFWKENEMFSGKGKLGEQGVLMRVVFHLESADSQKLVSERIELSI